MLTTIERTEGCYEVQEVAFGRVYRWSPGRINIECECGERLNLTAVPPATCHRCGANHAPALREELTGGLLDDQALHPWRYDATKLEEVGLPY